MIVYNYEVREPVDCLCGEPVSVAHEILDGDDWDCIIATDLCEGCARKIAPNAQWFTGGLDDN